MKIVSLIVVSVGLLLASCSSALMPISEKMRIVVDNLERNGSVYTEEQFARCEMQYNSLLEELKQNEGQLSPEELKLITKEIARYNGLQMRYNVESAAEGIKTLYQLLPSMAEGFMEGFESGDGLEGLEQKLHLIIDEIVSSSEQLKSEEGQLDRIMQSVERISDDVESASEKIDSIFSN